MILTNITDSMVSFYSPKEDTTISIKPEETVTLPISELKYLSGIKKYFHLQPSTLEEQRYILNNNVISQFPSFSRFSFPIIDNEEEGKEEKKEEDGSAFENQTQDDGDLS